MKKKSTSNWWFFKDIFFLSMKEYCHIFRKLELRNQGNDDEPIPCKHKIKNSRTNSEDVYSTGDAASARSPLDESQISWIYDRTHLSIIFLIALIFSVVSRFSYDNKLTNPTLTPKAQYFCSFRTICLSWNYLNC